MEVWRPVDQSIVGCLQLRLATSFYGVWLDLYKAYNLTKSKTADCSHSRTLT